MKMAKNAAHGLLPRAGSGLTFAAYMRDRHRTQVTGPASATAIESSGLRSRMWHEGKTDEGRLFGFARHRRRTGRTAHRHRHQGPRAGHHRTLADPGQALALGGRAGWDAGQLWPPSTRSEGDNEDVHFADTVKGSDWGCDQAGRPHVRQYGAQGDPRAGDVGRALESGAKGRPRGRRQRRTGHAHRERRQAHGLITARDFGGTKKWRTCYTADGTGHTMLYAMDNKAIEDGHPGPRTQRGDRSDPRRRDLSRRDRARLITGELIAYVAKATTIATGGYGRIYAISTNAVISEGIGAAIALETGVAPLGNMEAVQFHPTAIVPGGNPHHRGLPRRRRPVEGRRRLPLHAGLRAGQERAGLVVTWFPAA